MSILVQFPKNLYFWNENEKLDQIDPIFEKKFKGKFFGGGIISFLENSYLKCEENVRTFPNSFRLVPHNLSGIPPILWPTMWQECEEKVSVNDIIIDSHFENRDVSQIEVISLNILGHFNSIYCIL